MKSTKYYINYTKPVFYLHPYYRQHGRCGQRQKHLFTHTKGLAYDIIKCSKLERKKIPI